MQTLILLMAGSGSRAHLDINKMMYQVNGKKLYRYVLDKFLKYDLNIILVTSQTDYSVVLNEVPSNVKVVLGGKTRNESVSNALKLVNTERVMIHDAARVLVSDEIIQKCLNSNASAYYVYNHVKDTIRTLYNKTIDRSSLVSVQTPQGGLTNLFRETNSLSTTDDISGLENMDIDIEKILGDDYNFKVTTPYDIKIVEHILKGEF